MHFTVDQHAMVGLREAQRILKVGRSTVHDLIRNGSLPAQKIGKEWCIQTKTLQAWLTTHPCECEVSVPEFSAYEANCAPGYEFIGDWT